MNASHNYGIISFEEMVQVLTFDVVKVVAGKWLTDQQIRQWVQIKPFVDEVLNSYEKYENFDARYVIHAMNHCIDQIKELREVNRVRVDALIRSRNILERNYKQIRNFDEIHSRLRRETFLQNREILYWRKVPDFDERVREIYEHGIPFTNENVLSIMTKILELNPASVEISGARTDILIKIVGSLRERINRSKEVTDG